MTIFQIPAYFYLTLTFLNEVVDNVVPNGDGVYEWNVNFGRTNETVKLVAVGDKRNKKERPYVYIYGQEADNSASALHNNSSVVTIVRYDFIATQLHRQVSIHQSYRMLRFLLTIYSGIRAIIYHIKV